MDSPVFTLAEFYSVSMYTDPYAPTVPKSDLADALTSNYEFRFFPADWPGGITIDGVFYASKKDHFSCCKPGQIRKLTQPLQCYYFYITTRDPQMRQALNKLPAFGYYPEMDAIISICRHMKHDIVDRNTLDARMQMCAGVYQILSMLIRQQFALTDAIPGNPRRHQQALMEADQYLRNHIAEDVDLHALAKSSNLTPTYFHKLFKAAFGRTPIQQLFWYRHLAATNYLRDDDCPIAEVAAKCGYSNQSYFCSKFKQFEGITPSQFRQNRRRQRTSPKRKRKAL